MKALWVCGPEGLAEPGLELKVLKPGGLCEAMLEPEELGNPFSQPADTRKGASGESRDGA